MADCDCESPLPVNRITESFTFGQFIRLAQKIDDVTATVELTAPARADRPRFTRPHPVVSLSDALADGGRRSAPPEPQPEVREIGVRDLDGLLATGRVSDEETEFEIPLTRPVVAALLRGRPVRLAARTRAGKSVVLLRPPGPERRQATAPAVTEHEITDLAAFLTRPRVPGLEGLPFRLSLSARNVGELRRVGRTTVELAEEGGGGPVELRMRPRDDDPVPDRSPDLPEDRPVEPDTPEVEAPEDTPAEPVVEGATGDPAAPIPGTGQVVLFLPWRQTWRLNGYSRGPLLTSPSLGPQEETTIEIFSWDRSKRSLEQSSSTDVEQSFESSDTTKDVIDVVRDMTRNENLQLQANASLRVLYGAVDAQISGGVNRTETVSNVAKRTANHLTEAVSRAATRVRTNRQTKIVESSEVGREERVTRRVRNVNQCRTLTLDYFEVVANYEITTTFAKDDAAVCVLIGLPVNIRSMSWTSEDLRTHERALRLALLDPAMAPGFAAARMLAAREAAFKLVCEKAACEKPETAGAQGGGEDDEPPDPPELVSARQAMSRLSAGYRGLYTASCDPLMAAWNDGYEPPSTTHLLGFRMWIYRMLLTRLLPRLKQALDGILSGYEKATAGQLTSAWTALAGALPSPGGLNQLDSLHTNTDDISSIIWTAVDRYADSAAEANWYWNTLAAWRAKDPDDNGLPALVESVRSAMSALAQAAAPDDPGTPGGAAGGANEQQAIDTDTDRVDFAFPLREVAEATERADALRRHIMAHDQYYKFAVFQLLPLGDQIQHFGTLGLPVELLEPRVIGAIQTASGVLMAIPINPALSADAQRALDLFLIENPEIAGFTAGREVTLPTPGASCEGRLGGCDCCEPETRDRHRLERERMAAETDLIRHRAAWQAQDTRRYRLRLDRKPPDLDDPRPPSAAHLVVSLERPKEPPAPPSR